MEVEKLCRDLEEQKVLFVAGSGISGVSGVPGTAQVLRETLKGYLPNRGVVEDQVRQITGKDLENSFQPEIVYEQLMLLDGLRCLDIWEVLREPYPPTLTHQFLVRYAHWSGLPLITTNFDLLFEEAGRELQLQPVVYVPGQEPVLQRRAQRGEFLLWKVHGSIGQDAGGLESLCTTMESISRANYPLLGALDRVLEGRNLCFVGYSGRDIDLFPELCRRLGRDQHTYWLTGPVGRSKSPGMAARIDQARGSRIDTFPDDMLRTIQDQGMLKCPELRIQDCEALIERARKAVESKIGVQALRQRSLPPSQPENEALLAVLLLMHRGLYAEAWSRAVAAQQSVSSPFPRCLLVLAMTRLSHECSRYLDCEDLALEGLREARRMQGSEGLSFLTIFRCLVAEARRMQVAAPMQARALPQSTNWGLAFFALGSFVLAEAQMVLDRLREDSGSDGARAKVLRVQADFERIEHRIRAMSLIQKPFVRLMARIPRLPRRMVLRVFEIAWVSLASQSYKIGYGAGIANAFKFLARVEPQGLEDNRLRAHRVYVLTHQTTGEELLLADDAADHLARGEGGKAEIAYRQMLEKSEKSGNVLNSVKALLGILLCLRDKGQEASGQAPPELAHLRRLTPLVQGADWQRALSGLEDSLAVGEGAERIQPLRTLAVRGRDLEIHYGLEFQVPVGATARCRSSLRTWNADWLPVFDRRHRGGVSRWNLTPMPDAEHPDRRVLFLPRTWLIRNGFLPISAALSRSKERRLHRPNQLLREFWAELI